MNLLIALLALLVSSSSASQEALPAYYIKPSKASFAQVTNGMSLGEVIKILGPAEEKVLLESKRFQRCKFGDREILFSEGRVVQFAAEESEVAPLEKQDEMLVTAKAKV